MTWPHPGSDWQPFLDSVEPVYDRLCAAISRHERVLVVCRDPQHRAHVSRRLKQQSIAEQRLSLVCIPTNDTWVRDYGPLASANERGVILHDFGFDAWGNKYPSDRDRAVTSLLLQAGCFGNHSVQRHDLVLEGGSVDTDGAGTLLTTRQCLLDHSRNPGIDRLQFETAFRELLDIRRVLWLEHGELAGDDTDAHVDMLARFCSIDTIAHISCSDPLDEHYAPLQAMAVQLRQFRRLDGEPYRLVALPLPAPVVDDDGRRLPASYANFLVINGAVLVPVYNDPADATALAALAGCFPGRTIEPVDCRALVQQYGSLHCATMQLPAGILADCET